LSARRTRRRREKMEKLKTPPALLSPVGKDLLDRLDVLDGGERVAGLGELEPGLGVGLGGLDGADEDGAASERGGDGGRTERVFFLRSMLKLKRMKNQMRLILSNERLQIQSDSTSCCKRLDVTRPCKKGTAMGSRSWRSSGQGRACGSRFFSFCGVVVRSSSLSKKNIRLFSFSSILFSLSFLSPARELARGHRGHARGREGGALHH